MNVLDPNETRNARLPDRYASEQKDRIDAIIARTHSNPALRIQILTIESQYCDRARLWIELNERKHSDDHELNLSLMRNEGMTWETRERRHGEMKRRIDTIVGELRQEYAAFGAAKEVADEHVRQAQSAEVADEHIRQAQGAKVADEHIGQAQGADGC